jgi:hypothetical protein
MSTNGRVHLVIIFATALAWIVSAAHFLVAKPAFWDPVSISDYFAVYAYSTAWLSLAAASLVVGQLGRAGPGVRITAMILAAACVVTGVANALEDGVGIAAFGNVYVGGIVGATACLFILALLAFRGRWSSVAVVSVASAIGVLTVSVGGGLVVGAAWAGFGWFMRRGGRAPTPATLPAP